MKHRASRPASCFRGKSSTHRPPLTAWLPVSLSSAFHLASASGSYPTACKHTQSSSSRALPSTLNPSGSFRTPGKNELLLVPPLGLASQPPLSTQPSVLSLSHLHPALWGQQPRPHRYLCLSVLTAFPPSEISPLALYSGAWLLPVPVLKFCPLPRVPLSVPFLHPPHQALGHLI